MKSFSLVVAMDEQNGIGKNGDLAWRLPADLKRFKEITTVSADPAKQNTVIMGRKTWDSLPEKFRPLPGRLNAVLSTQSTLNLQGKALSFSNLDQALEALSVDPGIAQIFVIGGAQVYTQAIVHPACQGLYITQLKGNFDCDAFFPAIPAYFKKTEESPVFTDGTIQYSFYFYQKI